MPPNEYHFDYAQFLRGEWPAPDLVTNGPQTPPEPPLTVGFTPIRMDAEARPTRWQSMGRFTGRWNVNSAATPGDDINVDIHNYIRLDADFGRIERRVMASDLAALRVNRNPQGEKMSYNLHITSISTGCTVPYNTSKGDIFVGLEGLNKDKVWINIGGDRMVCISHLEGTSKYISDNSFPVRVLSSSEALTLIVR